MIKVSICIVLLLLLPACWGSMWQYVWQLWKHKNMQTGSWYLTGWMLFLAGFEILALAAGLCDMTLQRLAVWTAVLAAALALPALAAAIVSRRYRGMVKQKLVSYGAKESRMFAVAFVVSFALIAIVYIIQGFTTETYYSVPEEVTAILESGYLHRINPLTGQLYGEMGFADKLYTLPALYAVIAKLAGVRTEVVLFCIMPYIVLAGMLLSLGAVSSVFFEKRTARAVVLFAFAAVILCGSGAYMHVPYDILHVPYESGALLGAVLMPYLLYLFAAAKSMWSGDERIAVFWQTAVQMLFCLLAALCFAGMGRGVLPALMEIVLLLLSTLLIHAVKAKKRNK